MRKGRGFYSKGLYAPLGKSEGEGKVLRESE